jgi:peroxiredoxin
MGMSAREAPGAHDPTFLPPDIPIPRDDGAARHLLGMKLPDVELPATSGPPVNLSKLKGRIVVYIYPRTGVPGVDALPGWDDIPGARGCTPQSCGFRDHFAELKTFGVASVFGLSTQDTDYQREAAQRLHLPFPLLSDAALKLGGALRLPTFSVAGMTLLKRMALVIDHGAIVKVFYPVFPPDRNAEELISWLRKPAS